MAESQTWAYRVSRSSLAVGLRLWNRLSVEGLEKVPASGGCVIATNHTSFLDPPIIAAATTSRMVRFMARDSLFKGFLGWWLPRSGVIPISRDRGDVGALRRSIEELRQGRCVGLFPEGTRSTDGELQPAKGGIGFLLAKASVPVVPAYIHGAFAAYPRGQRRIRPVHIHIVYGSPIPAEEIAALGKDRTAYEKAGELVMGRIAALREAFRSAP